MKIKMNTQRNAFMALLLLVAVVLACSLGDETDKANKLVNDANTALTDGKKFLEEGDAKKTKMLEAIPEISSEAELEAARVIAKDCISSYDKAIAKYKEAAQKSDEAAKLKLNEKFKDYLTLKGKEYNKRVEIFEAMKGVPQALIDSPKKAAFETAVSAVKTKVDALVKEADDLAAQADKIQKDNPDKIKAA